VQQRNPEGSENSERLCVQSFVENYLVPRARTADARSVGDGGRVLDRAIEGLPELGPEVARVLAYSEDAEERATATTFLGHAFEADPALGIELLRDGGVIDAQSAARLGR
jgi:hypothetical protein